MCLELTYEHTRNGLCSRWKSVWGERLLQSGMVAWLLQLANGIDEASVEPGEFANVQGQEARKGNWRSRYHPHDERGGG